MPKTTAKKDRQTLNTEALRQRLKLRSLVSETELLKKHPKAAEFYKRINLRPGQIREHAARLITSGALAGSLLLNTGAGALPVVGHGGATQQAQTQLTFTESQAHLAKDLQTILPPVGQWQLTSGQEEEISKKIRKVFGVKAVPKLEGNRLNNDYGRMGAEQHLPRYPGDTAQAHGEFVDKGITPGLGGWGYVSDFEVEKWYVAVQTLYLPDWNTRTQYLVNWYKFRRVVVVNPANGKALVGAVADAGPAEWTGKHFGGSPEVMNYLGIDYGMQNHPVVLFFLDDPGKKVPLGPLEYNVEENQKLLANRTQKSNH